MNSTKSVVAVVLATAALAGLQQGAAAQQAARVSEIARVVKARRANSTDLVSVGVNAPLAVGDALRTGGRSAAGLRFEDQSGLRIGELTEIVVSGTKKKDARLVRGRVVADFKTPGVIRSGSAIAAVRGTKVDFLVDDNGSSINCYSGRVFVAGANNPLVAGTTSSLTGTTLTDPDLQGYPDDFTNGQIRFVDGPFNGQFRTVTGFNPATGVVTFTPALAGAPGEGPSGYLLVKDPNAPVVELTKNTGTLVRPGGGPSAPFRVAGEEFARLDRNPFTRSMRDGDQVYVYPGTPDHFREEEIYWLERRATSAATRPDYFRDCCPDEPSGGRHGLGVRSALQRSFTQDRSPRAGGDAPVPTPEYRNLNAINDPDPTVGNRTSQFRFEPFIAGSDEHDFLGTRLRYQAVQGQVYAEFGYLYQLIDGQSNHDVSELFFHVRGKHGDVIAGRQHLFLTPSNNNDLGTLLGLNTADAVVLQTSPGAKFDQQVGYVFNTRPLGRGGYPAGYARGQTDLLGGRIGYSVLAANERGRNIGYQGDISMPVIRNVLDVYGQAGVGVRGRELYLAGIYIPALYHKYKVDVFAEYANRQHLNERVSLRIRREMGRNLLLVGFAEQDLGTSFFAVGGGVFWSKKFR